MNTALMDADFGMGMAAWFNRVKTAFFAAIGDKNDPVPSGKAKRSVKKTTPAKPPKPKKNKSEDEKPKPSKPRSVKKKSVQPAPASASDLEAADRDTNLGLGEFQPLSVVSESQPENPQSDVPVNEIPKDDLPFIVPRENPIRPERPVSRSLKYSPDSFAVPPRRKQTIRLIRFWGSVAIILAIVFLGVNVLVQNRPAVPASSPTETSLPASEAPVADPTESPAAAAPSAIPPTKTAVPPTPTPTVVPTLGVNSTTIGEDGMVMVYVPEGEFTMGSEAGDDEQPVHQVTLSAFWIDQTEVTNAMYLKCVDAGACQPPISIASHARDRYFYNLDFANYPVVQVSWTYANQYCAWAGRRLPTEAEWEKAARGTEAQTYPWGEQVPDPSLLNLDVRDTTEVGRFPSGVSPFGALDMAGNVWEWVADWYAPSYYAESPAKDPQGPDSPIDPTFGELRVLRGGSWDQLDGSVRSADRSQNGVRFTNDRIGFRCAMSASK